MNIGPSDPIDHADITQGSDLSGMDLTGVDLTSADLSESYLSNVILAGADLSEVCFVNTHLTGADLTDTTLAGADLSNATLTGADLSNADLSGADLSDADLINTDLTDATLRGVDLSNATFAGADLTGADLRGTALTDNEIRGANASEARKDTTTTTTADTAGADASLSDLSQGKSADQKKSDELLTILQSLYDQLDRVPKSTELPENSKYSPNDFYTEFGSWDEALEAAGIDKEQALLDELNRVGEKLGHVPKNSEISAHGKYSYSTYSSYFGSWDEALQQSGFEGKSRTRCESNERSREEMLSTLQSLHERLDRVPKTTDLHDMSGVSQHNYIQTFGSWDKALEAAGIDKEQAILDEIERVAKRVGHVPKTGDINEHGTYSYSMYSSYFDSWDEALQHSGIRERFETESRESSEKRRKEMINTVQSLYDQLDRVPKSTELPEKYSPRDFYTEFGSWDEALEAAGIDEEQAILDEIKRVAKKLGHIPTTTDIHKHGRYPAEKYSSYFESWDEALRESGVKEGSSKDMINTLQSLHNELDKIPKTTELPKRCEYTPHDFYTEFGGWHEALKAAGILKEQALLEDLNQVAEEVGHVPKTSDVDKHGTHSCNRILSYFDSWDEALEAAGIDKKQAILDEIERVAEELGDTPTIGDIDKHSGYPASDYSSYFDSWDEALRKSGVKEMFETRSAGDESEDSAKIPDEESQSSIHEDVDSADFADLSGFKRDILYIISGLKKPKGLEIKKELENYYDEEINHGRLYPNLDSIEDAGLINKFEIDARSNGYKLTTVGAAHLRARLKWKAPAINGSVTGTDRAEMLEDIETSAQKDNDHKQSQSTTTAKSETSPEKKDNDSIEILDEIANEFEKL